MVEEAQGPTLITTTTPPTQAMDSEKKRLRSTIQFPYNDLNDAVSVATAIHENAGAGSCELAQLAAWMKHENVDSGAFRLKIAAARLFGLINAATGAISLTSNGRDIVDPSRTSQARVQAFLSVPLYKALYEKHKGYPLPSDVGLERQIEELGVSPKQKDKARQTFVRSADQAGFFSQGKGRLVLPSNAVLPSNTTAESAPPVLEKAKSEPAIENGERSGNGGGHGRKPPLDLHPFIEGLLTTLPEPGKPWPIEKRKHWLTAADNIFTLLYPDD